MRKLLYGLLIAATLAAGCRSDPANPAGSATPSQQPSPRAQASPSQEPSPGRAEPDCPNQDSATADPDRSGSLTGDVDGDGSEDTLLVAIHEGAEPGCRAFLVADTATGMLAEEISDPDISFDLGLPTLEGTAQVDARPGNEVLVRILAGASTLFVGLFTVHEGELERIEISGTAPYGNLFPWGGSVGHLEGSDCTDDGLVVSQALPQGRRYEVTRTFYTLSDTRARRAGSESEVVRPRNLDRYPELAGPPFANCGS